MGINDQLTDGLPSDFEATISEVTYMRDTKYNNGQTLLASFTLTRTDGEDDVEQRYALGAGWDSVGGERLTHETASKINKQTQYGQFCARVAGLVPPEVGDTLDVLAAKSFVGLTFYWERISEHREFKTATGEQVSRDVSRLFPTRYIAAEGATAEAAPQTTTTLVGGGVAVTLPENLALSVKSFAINMDYAKWQSAALAVPGALDYDDLIKAVSNEGFYQAIREAK